MLHSPLPIVGVSVGIERECQANSNTPSRCLLKRLLKEERGGAGETAIPLHPPLAFVGVSIRMGRECQQNRQNPRRPGSGWNHWQRDSQLSVQALPQQFGVQLSVQVSHLC